MRQAAIPGYEGLYYATDTGIIVSLPRPSTRGGPLKPGVNQKGYEMVVLTKNGEQWHVSVHILVALAFHGPRPEGMTDIRHLNNIKTDNRPENLKYGTRSENQGDLVNAGIHHQTRKTHCPSGHEYTEENTRVYEGRRYCRACKRVSGRALPTSPPERIL